MKHAILTALFLATSFASAQAQTALWLGSTNDDWGTATNWDSGTVPDLSSGNIAIIDNGDTVTYPAATLLDLVINNAGALTVSNGSRWQQSTTHWTQIVNGAITVQDATFARSASGNFVAGFSGDSNAAVNIMGGAIEIGGEFWLGHTGDHINQTVSLNISDGGSLTTSGGVGLWLWDPDAAGNDFSINFSGTPGGSITVSDRFGIRVGGTGDNVATWESLWELGLLTSAGVSGLDGALFGDHFSTIGTSAADEMPYTLTSTFVPVPEPSTYAALLGLSAIALATFRKQRRRC